MPKLQPSLLFVSRNLRNKDPGLIHSFLFAAGARELLVTSGYFLIKADIKILRNKIPMAKAVSREAKNKKRKEEKIYVHL